MTESPPTTPVGAHHPPAAGRTASGVTEVALAMGLANLLGYALNLVASRALGPSGFGILGALLGLVLIGNVVALSLQAVTARTLARRDATAGAARELYRVAAVATAGMTVLALAATPLVTWLLRLSNPLAPVLLALLLAPLTMTGVQLGLAQGAEAFRRLAVLYLLAALGKVGGGLAGLALGDSVTATMAGSVVGAATAAALGHLLVRDLVGPRRTGVPMRDRLGELAHATHALLLLFAVTNLDVVVARQVLAADEAGRYAVGAVVAKAAFWLPGFVAVVALPALADSLRRRRAASLSIAAVATCGVLVTGGTLLLGDLVVALVGGAAYESLAPSAWLFAGAGSLFALSQVLIYSRLATGDRRVVAALWVSLLVLLTLVAAGLNDSLREIVAAALAAGAVLVVAGVLAELDEHRSRGGHSMSAGQPVGR